LSINLNILRIINEKAIENGGRIMVENMNHTIDKRPEKVHVFLASGESIIGKRGDRIEKFLRKSKSWRNNDPIVGAVINGKLRELTYKIDIEVYVRPVHISGSDGALIYRRSLTFLLAAAFEELFPNCKLIVDHSVTSGGYFCRVIDREPLNVEELEKIENKMRSFVEQDLPFQKTQVALEDAISIFEEKGFEEKVTLLRFRQKKHLVLYQLGKHFDYHHGYMVPSTRYLRTFGLAKAKKGFILRFPRRKAPHQLQPVPESNKLIETFMQYSDWLNRLSIDSVGSLNCAIESNRIRELILVTEALHELKISDLATKIIEEKDHLNLILIAGPSSSGKTTSSKRLTVQLIAQGVSPYTLELDKYFVDRDKTPRDENGEFDFESLAALNIERLNSDLLKLSAGEAVQLPKFDFITGQSLPGDVVKLEKGQLIIMEGIHGLNPNLLPDFPAERAFRIYASCLTQLNLDRYNRISTTDTRLIRRIVRDARERGYSAQATINRWDSVRRGEKRHIFPFQEFADEMLNSALVYELSALKPFAEPLLRQVNYQSEEYIEANRLLSMLEWFLPLDSEMVPDNSILREFIGGSILKEFDPRHI